MNACQWEVALVDGPNIPEEWDDEATSPRLPLRSPKVVPLHQADKLTHPEQDELVRRAPKRARESLRDFLRLTRGYRGLWATQARLVAATGADWATVKRHRALLVSAGILEPRGGGMRGKGPARYWIRTPAEVDAWVVAEAERRAAAGGCPICHEDPPTHSPRRCPSFGRPVQERLEVGE